MTATRSARTARFGALVALLVACTQAQAVVRLASPDRLLDRPAGAAGVAYDLQGTFGNFLATPIAPNLFVAARHIGGGGAGQIFNFAGQGYVTAGSTDIAGTDLRVFEIDTVNGTRTFPAFAPLYDAGASGSEVGRPLTVFGRGTQRGTAFTFNGETRGYLWGAEDRLRSRGESTVDAVVNAQDFGDLVAFSFSGPDGLALTAGDSSGGLFVLVDGAYQLAGVNAATDGSWSTTGQPGTFVSASIFDARGLFVGDDQESELIEAGLTAAVPGSSYSSRISSNRAAINQIFLATGNGNLVPEPATLAALAGGVLVITRRIRRA